MYEEIIYEVSDPVAVITLNRPAKLNAWTQRMGDEVRHAMTTAEADEHVVGIVLTGKGRGFCAGADMSALDDLAKGEAKWQAGGDLASSPGDPAMKAFRGTYTYPMSMKKPVIAAINGACAGMAVPIALACDLRFASTDASFITAFSRRGLVAEWGISWLLPRLVGPAVALDLLFSSRKVGGEEACRIGLVNRVLAADELLPAARGYIEELAEKCSPESMRIMKGQVYRHLAAALDEAENETLELMASSFSRPDFAEGVSSFLQKRSPKFQRL